MIDGGGGGRLLFDLGVDAHLLPRPQDGVSRSVAGVAEFPDHLGELGVGTGGVNNGGNIAKFLGGGNFGVVVGWHCCGAAGFCCGKVAIGLSLQTSGLLPLPRQTGAQEA